MRVCLSQSTLSSSNPFYTKPVAQYVFLNVSADSQNMRRSILSFIYKPVIWLMVVRYAFPMRIFIVIAFDMLAYSLIRCKGVLCFYWHPNSCDIWSALQSTTEVGCSLLPKLDFMLIKTKCAIRAWFTTQRSRACKKTLFTHRDLLKWKFFSLSRLSTK